jgi:hypothetical protein
VENPTTLELDLQRHFANQLRELIENAADTMQRVDINGDAIALLLMAALLRETCGAAWALKMNEETFLAALQMAYREYLPQYRKLAKQAGK